MSASPTLDDAYAWCAQLAGTHYENFPVASRLLPPRMRPHIAAVYAFARIADDYADEGDRTADERLRLLDAWGACLRASAAGDPVAVGDPRARFVFTALGASMRECHLPTQLFEDLLSAFRQDVVVQRYDDWSSLLDYCRRSANPVGRLVLTVAGYREERLHVGSDAICTALQLTNFWQDFGQDWRRGRLYVPSAVTAAHGADEDDVRAGRWTPQWRDALRDVVGRTRALFENGRWTCDSVGGRLRYELRATWAGGMRILDRIDHADFEVLTRRPRLGFADAPRILWRTLAWRRGAP